MSEAIVQIRATVTSLGSDIEKAVRFSTTAPTAITSGYGTIAAAATLEAIPVGQVATSLVYGLYLKSVDNTIYYGVASAATATMCGVLASGEATFWRPAVSLGVAVSIMVACSTAGANYEYSVWGVTS